jgi:hypothetical protein
MRGDLSRVQRQYFFTNAPNCLPALIRATNDAGRLQICVAVFGPMAPANGKRNGASEVAPLRCEV